MRCTPFVIASRATISPDAEADADRGEHGAGRPAQEISPDQAGPRHSADATPPDVEPGLSPPKGGDNTGSVSANPRRLPLAAGERRGERRSIVSSQTVHSAESPIEIVSRGPVGERSRRRLRRELARLADEAPTRSGLHARGDHVRREPGDRSSCGRDRDDRPRPSRRSRPGRCGRDRDCHRLACRPAAALAPRSAESRRVGAAPRPARADRRGLTGSPGRARACPRVRLVCRAWRARRSACERCGSAASARPGRRASRPGRCARSSAGRASASRTCSPPSGRCSSWARRTPRPRTSPRARSPTIRLSATLADGGEIDLETSPPGPADRQGPALPVVFLPASERSRGLVAHPTTTSFPVVDAGSSSAAPAAALVTSVEALCERGESGLVLLIEEPELFLRPQAQRYLHRLLRDVRRGRQPGALLDPLGGVPRRRPPRGARRSWSGTHARHDDRPARAAAGRRRASARSASSTPSGASSSSRGRCCSSRGAPRSSTFPFVFARARPRRRPARDLDHRVRRQAEHPALRPDLPGGRRPVRGRARPRRRRAGSKPIPAERVAQRADRASSPAPERVDRPDARLRGGRRPPIAEPQAGPRVGALLGARRRRGAGAARARGRAHDRARAPLALLPVVAGARALRGGPHPTRGGEPSRGQPPRYRPRRAPDCHSSRTIV